VNLQTKFLLHTAVSILIAMLIMSVIIIRLFDLQGTAQKFSNTLLEVEQINSSLVSYQQSLENYGKNPSESNLLHMISKHYAFMEKAEQLNQIDFINEQDQQRLELFHSKVKRSQQKMAVVTEEENVTVAIQLSSIINGVLNDIHLLKDSLKQQYQIMQIENNREIVVLSVISGLALLVTASVWSFISTRKIVNPIRMLNEYSKRIAAGDLEVQDLKRKSNDEVGQLTTSFNTMKLSLFSLVGQLQKSADELHTLANTDELTKLFNRRYFMNEVKQMTDETFSIILFDIDNFKKINDRYGHLVGDQVIVHVASILKRAVPDESICGRFGGEEFIVLLPGMDNSEAVRQADLLRAFIEHSTISVGREPLAVTCSFGVADSFNSANVMEVVQNADKGLYLAKENGKNLVKSVD
jgi:diguanylate cyclase (GGDEF)-like protein